ncbi:ion transporter [Mesohalobacter halotolerans]|uniref:Ion transporter n=1 Tax=Mesohalobacter halotolerans TaxID=1883405 RepID=A0A4U5TRE7_9FLAO|nr:ion transporter [Mesohalobacter halotolerans]MBS3739136.1 ion transporter [Psychroflexus sp.]TKS56666.1 ion transporter [Mesohalobacter halotolerans]
MKEKLRTIIESSDTKAGLYFDFFIQFLILSSLIAFTVETFPDNSPQTQNLLWHFEVFCVVIFSIEYILRIYVADKPLKYIFSFYGIIDLMAILPFYIKTFLDLRALRVFRIFRIFRIFKLVRYNKALRRFHIAFNLIKEELVLFLMLTSIFLFIASAGIYYFEHKAQPEYFSSVVDSGWWAAVTLTTVGYGDVYPITAGGKIFTLFILLLGVGIITIPAGLIASALSKARKMEEENLKN